ncbi:MAG: 16S rRNA (guanine(527)-N(7))-methyltransferase RsmG [Bauldia sp.]|uniref:16S rRNA (guanine(527)-N(7))-methyltransferase RsmG n=1 Tax=Bauldia sp. TaxID=2575872 RepID=UPI001D79AE70|nr:16S rRNA (guanine(527)-N(7))-methyltransferase RsmG [Bauldia sp.]MCB1498010.1 16S rRNA (guanine(527)-N(7))-methyltransferase RsmG [Bauldia sp.]
MSPDSESVDGPDAIRAILGVSRETLARLEALVALVRKWQPAENLVAPATLPEIWRRHVADSAQLVALFPDARRWLDLGSGGGFPGLVLGCLLAGQPGAAIHLVESNGRKCAFLRTATRQIGLPVTVHQGRIETMLAGWSEPVDRVTARALAPLAKLLDLSEPVLATGVPAAFYKGADFVREIDEAALSWGFDLVKHQSRINMDGVILEIRQPVRRDAGSGIGDETR